MRRAFVVAAVGVVLACPLWLWACAPRRAPVTASASLPEDAWSRGVWLYGQHCAGCHGDNGEGGDDAPPLAGQGALPRDPRPGSDRTTSFGSAADVFALVREQMPPMDPGSLSDEECWALMVYVLKQASIPAPAELGPTNAASVTLR